MRRRRLSLLSFNLIKRWSNRKRNKNSNQAQLHAEILSYTTENKKREKKGPYSGKNWSNILMKHTFILGLKTCPWHNMPRPFMREICLQDLYLHIVTLLVQSYFYDSITPSWNIFKTNAGQRTWNKLADCNQNQGRF